MKYAIFWKFASISLIHGLFVGDAYHSKKNQSSKF